MSRFNDCPSCIPTLGLPNISAGGQPVLDPGSSPLPEPTGRSGHDSGDYRLQLQLEMERERPVAAYDLGNRLCYVQGQELFCHDH